MIKPFLIYVHIERCGGTTMHNLLRSHFPFYTTIKPRRWSNELDQAFTKQYLLKMLKIIPFCQGIGGHTIRPFMDYNSVLRQGSDKFMFTFLRNPIERYLSHYYYQKQVMQIPWTMEAFLDETRFSNFQTVKIAGAQDAQKAIDIVKNNFDFIGLSEQYDASLLMLFKKFGMRPNYELKNALVKKKENKTFDDFSSSIRERIIENNKQDQILYDFVLQHIFPNEQNRFSGNLDKELITFKKENKTFAYNRAKRLTGILFKYINYYGIQPVIYG